MSTITFPTFKGITEDMLTKVISDRRVAKMIHPVSVTLNKSEYTNNVTMLRETDYTIAFRYKATIDQFLSYNDPSIDDMIKDQAVRALNHALYGDLREDINKAIDGLFNNPNIYETATALRKIVDKIVV